MDWTAIILAVIGGGSIGSLLSSIIHRKSNKTIKESEATQSDVEAQKSEINLANLYKQNMLEMMEQFRKNDFNQELMIGKLDRLDERMEKMEIKVSDIEGYLNGPYHQYIANKETSHNPNV